MITANITHWEPAGRLAVIQVQVLDIWADSGRAWAKVRALDGRPFLGLRNGRIRESDWTVVDRIRLRDVTLIPPAREKFQRKGSLQRYEETLLRTHLLGGSRRTRAA